MHPDDERVTDSTRITLNHMPAYLLVKMDHTRLGPLNGLTERVVPIEPVTHKMQIKIKTDNGQVVKRTVERSQFAITPCYAFTDYRSQGQTVQRAIVDIAPPASGSISLFNLYVMLSRVPSRDCIRILRDFKDDYLLNKTFPVELKEEEDRLWKLHETLIAST
jgi:hypothetical protein